MIGEKRDSRPLWKPLVKDVFGYFMYVGNRFRAIYLSLLKTQNRYEQTGL